MTEWEEVKRLAADFQKVQLGSASQRLSERNCIEIISWLRDKNLIDLIFTSDGKECLTPEQLIRDMQDEIYAIGGRIDIVDLARVIGVDLVHINNHINTLLRNQKNLNLVVGQLIDSFYINKIVMEINEKLATQGQINVNELSIHYNLPGEFLQQVLERNLNKTLQGKQDNNDPKVFFTEYFIARNVSRIKGALFGLSKPTPVSSILNQIDVAEKLFFSLFDQTAVCGTITSRLSGAQYVPDIYSKSVHKWVVNFFSQNYYLEYDILNQLGLWDHESFAKKQFPSEKIIHLKSCLISKNILERLLDEIEDCISNKTYVEITTTLPSVFNDDDISILFEQIMTPQRKQQIVVLGTYVLSLSFIDKLISLCDHVIQEKTKICVESGVFQEHKMKLQMGAQNRSQKSNDFEEKIDKKEERRKRAASGKSGGGAQGRETKTKSVKKGKGNIKNLDTIIIDNTDDKHSLEILKRQDVLGCIELFVENSGLVAILDEIIDFILQKLNVEALKLAENLYVTTVVDRTANRVQSHNELQQKLNRNINDVRLFEKGIKLFAQDVQPHLHKYVLKTICTDVVNDILSYLAQENNITVNLSNNDQKLKFVNELHSVLRDPILPIVKSLSSTNIEEFMVTTEEALRACNMIIKKVDKKKDRVIILNHKHELLEQLNKCNDLAMVLHLALLAIFTATTQCMLYVSGRHLQHVIKFLKQYMSNEDFVEISLYHDYVSLMLSGGSEEESVRQKLEEMVPTIRRIANEFKKPVGEKS